MWPNVTLNQSHHTPQHAPYRKKRDWPSFGAGPNQVLLGQRVLAVLGRLRRHPQRSGRDIQVIPTCLLGSREVNVFRRLFYIEKVEEREGLVSQMSGQTTSLRQKLIALRQDEVAAPAPTPVPYTTSAPAPTPVPTPVPYTTSAPAPGPSALSLPLLLLPHSCPCPTPSHIFWQVVRSSLEPVYGVFLKQRELHPSSVLQQCLLSIL